MDKSKVLLLVVCAGLAGVVVWQQSADVALVAPKPLQLMKPAAPAAGPAEAVTSATASAPAAVAPASDTSKTTVRRAPRREARPVAPVASSALHSASVAPAPEPAVAAPPTPAVAANDATVYETQAAARLQQGNYREAGDLFETAVRNGGKATFTVVHDHSKGNFEKDPKASCIGELVVTTSDIKFDGTGAGESHHFEASWAEVIEAGSNRFFGSGIGGFHVAINPDGKYKNINLAPKSKDKAEAKMIIDLLNASARGKTDRGGK